MCEFKQKLTEINTEAGIKLKAIYKARNTGMGNGMWGMQGMFTRIPGNLLEDSGECSHFSIPGSAREDPGECSRRFREMFKKILPGNVQEDSGVFSKGFLGMFNKIPGNIREDSGECSGRFLGVFKTQSKI